MAASDPTRFLPAIMSFYPAEHYKVDDDGSVDDWQNYTYSHPLQTATTSHTTDGKFSVDDASYSYPMIGTSSQDPYPSSQPMTWPAETRGLGFDTLQTPTQAMFSNTSSNLSTPNISSTWTVHEPQFVPNTTRPESTTAETRLEQCYPTASALTDYSQWRPLQQVPTSHAPVFDVPAYQTSPAQSDHSASSYSSLIASSPYAQSDGYFHPASPPNIKSEDSFDHSQSHLYSIPGTPQYENHSHIDPNDLFSQATSSAAAAQRAKNERDDLKYEQSLLRTAYATDQSDANGTGMSEAVRMAEAEARFKRGFTTAENSTCHCQVCGKLFQRPYNLKAHMETHDPYRQQPHACEYPDCKRRFVRKTDLTRHEQSVRSLPSSDSLHQADSALSRST